MIRKLKSGEYRLYSRKINPKTGKRRNLGTFKSREAAEQHGARSAVFQAPRMRPRLWSRLLTCGPIANRPAWRLATATQLGKLPHNRNRCPGRIEKRGRRKTGPREEM